MGVGVAVAVAVGDAVAVAVGEGVAVGVAEGEGVAVGARVAVAVGRLSVGGGLLVEGVAWQPTARSITTASRRRAILDTCEYLGGASPSPEWPRYQSWIGTDYTPLGWGVKRHAAAPHREFAAQGTTRRP